jgi:hypothetical protein
MANDVQLNIGLEAANAIRNLDAFTKRAETALGKVDKGFAGLQKAADKSSSALAGIGKGVGLIAGAAVAAVGVIASKAVIGAMGDFISAAAEQEQAIQNVAIAMAKTGEFSKPALDSVKDFAGKLQDTTGIADDAALKVYALAKSFGLSNSKAELATKAAVEYAAATGKDLNTAVQEVSKSFNGQVGKLKTLNPALGRLTKEQLEAGAAAKILLDQYGGTAAAKMNTFEGAVTGVKNRFGDVQEVIGDLVVKNPAIIELLKGVGGALKVVEDGIKNNSGPLREFVSNFAIGLLEQIPPIVLGLSSIYKGFKLLVGDTSIKGFFDGIADAISVMTDELTSALLAMAKLKRSLSDTGQARFAPNSQDQLRAITDLKAIGFDPEKASAESDAIIQRLKDAGLIRETAEDPTVALIKELEEIQKANREQKEKRDTGGGNFAEGSDATKPSDDPFIALAQTLTDAIAKAKDARDAGKETETTVPNLPAADGAGAARMPIIEGEMQDFFGPMNDALVKAAKGMLDGFLSGLMKGGREGAKDIVATVGGGVATAFFGPEIGQGVQQAIQFLGQDPEAFKEAINGMVEGIPDVIDAIVVNIPVLVETLADHSGEIITALAAASPRIAIALAEAMPYVAVSLLSQLGAGMDYQVSKFNQAADKFQLDTHEAGKVFSGQMKAAGDRFAEYFKIKVPDMTSALGRELGELGRDLFGGLADAGSAFYDTIASAGIDFYNNLVDVVNDLFGGNATGISVPGHAAGLTEVPSGYPNDTYFAGLTSGERVVDADANADLKAFLANPTSGGNSDVTNALLVRVIELLEREQTVTSDVKVDGQTLAKVYLKLSRQNARLSA